MFLLSRIKFCPMYAKGMSQRDIAETIEIITVLKSPMRLSRDYSVLVVL